MGFLSKCSDDASEAEARELDETTVYGTHWAGSSMPKYSMLEEGMPSDVAYRMVKDEISLDGNPALNLASFVTTFMEDKAEALMLENMSKNFIDFEEYPLTAELSNRCVNIISRLFHAPLHDATEQALGCSTVGSSEAIILATLAMKRRWQLARQSKGLPTDKPNLVLGANCQVAWHKATRYLEIESREVPCTEKCLYMDPHKAMTFVDENTIGVCAILGSTYTGDYEDVKTVDKLLERKCAEQGWDIGIHVDAASGGFVAPFVRPDLEWDFRLKRVVSINVSGHKYGLTYPGIGWAVWRSPEYLPQDLIFNINYLGSEQASFTLNFSKGAGNIVAQYYILLRLGKTGFRRIMTMLTETADCFADKLEKTGRFKILSARHGNGLPVVAFCLTKHPAHYDEFDVASKLRSRGWIVPAYTMCKDVSHLKLLRVVVREDFSRDRGDLLFHDIVSTLELLDSMDKKSVELNRKHIRDYTHSAMHRKAIKLKHNRTKDNKGKTNQNAPGVC